jgi:hypothetical protein
MIYIYIYLYIYIYILLILKYTSWRNTSIFSHPSSRPQLSCCSKVGLWVKHRRLRGASAARLTRRGHRWPPPPAMPGGLDSTNPWGSGWRSGGRGGLKVVVWCQDPKIWHFWWFFYICCWLLMIPVIFCGFIHWKNIVHPHDLWVRPTHVWHLLATNKNEMWPA